MRDTSRDDGTSFSSAFLLPALDFKMCFTSIAINRTAPIGALVVVIVLLEPAGESDALGQILAMIAHHCKQVDNVMVAVPQELCWLLRLSVRKKTGALSVEHSLAF